MTTQTILKTCLYNINLIQKTIIPVLLSIIWISASEFVRNEVLLKSYWIDHYENLGLVFPSSQVNGAVRGLWSLMFVVSIFIISRKFTLIQTTFLAWFVGFVLMWVVVWNLGMLPGKLLYAAIPLSLLEAFIAALIIHKLSPIQRQG